MEKVLEADPAALLALPGFDQDTVDAVMAAAQTEQAARAQAAPAEPEPAEASDADAIDGGMTAASGEAAGEAQDQESK